MTLRESEEWRAHRPRIGTIHPVLSVAGLRKLATGLRPLHENGTIAGIFIGVRLASPPRVCLRKLALTAVWRWYRTRCRATPGRGCPSRWWRT